VRRWAGVGAVVTVLTAAALIVMCRGRGPAADRVSVTEEKIGVQRGSGSSIGNVLHLHVPRRGDRPVSLRVYRDGAFVTGCPGDPGCRQTAHAIELDFRMERAGSYQVVTITGAVPPPSTAPSGIEADSLAADDAGAVFLPLPQRFDAH
jgi:hypothetical protein